jgi:hypothetical protein
MALSFMTNPNAVGSSTVAPQNAGLSGQQQQGPAPTYSYDPATGTSGFTNNGQSAVQGAINTGVGNSYGGLNTTTNNLNNMYSGMNSAYNSGLSGNQNDLSNILSSYSSFLSGSNPTGGSQSSFTGQPTSSSNSGSSGLGTFGSNMSNSQVNQMVNQYISAAGIPNTDGGAYWMNLWNNGGSSDPAYFQTKLLNGIQSNGGNMSAFGAPSSTAAGGYGPGTSGYSGGSSSGTSAIGGLQNFATTGGFTPAQISAMQQQGEASTRAAYQNMQNDLTTNAALTGGYAPNLAAAQSNLGRQSVQGISAADVATNANIAQMQQQGQLAGLSGLSSAQLGALSGMTGAYGASPGMTSTLGSQLLGTTGQQLTGNSLANQIAQLLISGQLGQSQVPSNANQALGTIAGYGNLAGTTANTIAGLSGYY